MLQSAKHDPAIWLLNYSGTVFEDLVPIEDIDSGFEATILIRPVVRFPSKLTENPIP